MIAGEGLDSIFAMVVEEFAIFAQATIKDLKADKDITAEDRAKTLVKLADGMTKAAAATKTLAPKVSELGVAQDVITRLLTFVEEEYPQHADAMIEIIEPFGEELGRAYG